MLKHKRWNISTLCVFEPKGYKRVCLLSSMSDNYYT